MSGALIVRRLLAALVVIVIAAFLTAMMVHLVPGDAAQAAAGDSATAEQVEIMREQMGLDKPILTQFTSWFGGVLQGDFGTSLVTGRSVWDSLTQALPATLSITLAAAFIGVVLGVALGVTAGIWRGTPADKVTSIVSSLGIAMPSFWLGMLLVTFFALELGWLPATGYVSPSEGLGEWAKHVILPAMALGFAMLAEVTRQTRSGVVEVMRQPYIRTATAKGVPGSRIATHHLIRNAAIPVVTVLGLQIGRLLGGVIVIEQVFGINGLGTLAINAVYRRDFPLLQAYVLLTTTIVVVLNLLVDLSYGWINPKVRAR